MAKLFATESAQQVIDAAVQMFGGLGVVRGMTVERLYREIRALRIYEGASEVLKLVIASRVLETIAGNALKTEAATPPKPASPKAKEFGVRDL
jgi:acyl-CoA dehydrogenase